MNIAKYPQEEVKRAIDAGLISKPDRCSECQRLRKVIAHHDDYAKPEDIRWLCYTCHMQWHRVNGPGANRHLTYRYLKDTREPGENRGAPRKTEPDARHAEMADLRAQGWTLEAIGQKYGITRERVRQIVRTTNKPKLKKDTAFDRCMEVLAAWESGSSKSEIVAEFGLTPSQMEMYKFPRRKKRIPHGTANGYNRGCRCTECTAADTLRIRQYRERKRADGFAGLKHGIRSTYAMGCKCAACIEGGRAAQRKNPSGYVDMSEAGKRAWDTRRARYGPLGKPVKGVYEKAQ